jgi:hypothetical protein
VQTCVRAPSNIAHDEIPTDNSGHPRFATDSRKRHNRPIPPVRDLIPGPSKMVVTSRAEFVSSQVSGLVMKNHAATAAGVPAADEASDRHFASPINGSYVPVPDQ